MYPDGKMSDSQEIQPYLIPLEITKRDDEKRLVFGFAKFAEDPDNRGFLLVDRQGDVITPEDLEDSAYSYVLDSRDSGEMHVTKGAATLVESVVITPEKLEAWGLPGDSVPVGWWTGYRVHEPEAGVADPWDKIVKGEYTAFSVEGLAVRQPLEKRDASLDSIAKSADEVEADRLAVAQAEEVTELAKSLEELVLDEDHAEAKADLLDAAREGLVTPEQAELLFKGLIESQAEVASSAGDDASDRRLASFFRAFLRVEKHNTGRPHPDSAHGNRLYSQAAGGVGDMMKQLKTRFKRVEDDTLVGMIQKFSGARDQKSALTHDQIMAELVRRNIVPLEKSQFITPRFKTLKDNLAAAVTQQAKESEGTEKEDE